MSSATSARAPVAVPSEAGGFHGDYLRGEGGALAFLPRHPAREGDWGARLEEVGRIAPARALWRRAEREGARLGAGEESLENARALARGEALCVTTGQQPGLFLGPLYTAYKTMTAIALAGRLQRDWGVRVVPVFWNASDDSDFGEAGAAFFAGAGFRLERLALDGGELPAGGMVGDLASAGTARLLEGARAQWSRRPSGALVVARLEGALARARDHGELATALLLALFHGSGLVVVDARWAELRRAGAPIFSRYAAAAEALSRAVVEAGRALEEAGYRARIPETSARRGVFDVSTGRRLPFEGTASDLRARAGEAPETLAPNVVLRPPLQDALFPNIATVAGPGEISYHAQLAAAYEKLGVRMPILFPRFEATLVPEGVLQLAERRGARLEDLVRNFDGTLAETAGRALPDSLLGAFQRLEERWSEGARELAREAERFDEALSGAVAQASRRVGEVLGKLRGKFAAAARAAEARRDPAIKRYREFLRPRGVPQERVLAALTLFLESGRDPLDCLEEVLEEHLVRTRQARPAHWLLEFAGCREEEA